MARRKLPSPGPHAEGIDGGDARGDGPEIRSFAIYEHCLPFNVSRAFDEASGIDDPVIWTDKRDQEMWAALQGGG